MIAKQENRKMDQTEKPRAELNEELFLKKRLFLFKGR